MLFASSLVGCVLGEVLVASGVGCNILCERVAASGVGCMVWHDGLGVAVDYYGIAMFLCSYYGIVVLPYAGSHSAIHFLR